MAFICCCKLAYYNFQHYFSSSGGPSSPQNISLGPFLVNQWQPHFSISEFAMFLSKPIIDSECLELIISNGNHTPPPGVGKGSPFLFKPFVYQIANNGLTMSSYLGQHLTLQAHTKLEILQEFPKQGKTINYLQPLLETVFLF